MSTLYITDLDGTLLNENAKLTTESANILNSLIDEGMLFTVATARSPATTVGILKDIKINLPVILMTGAIVYDINKKASIKTTHLSTNSVNKICDILEKTNQNAMAYSVMDSSLFVYHKNLTCPLEHKFVAPRIASPYKKFVEIDNYFDALKGTSVVMFLLCIPKLEQANKVYRLINEIEGICCYFYPYEYDDSGYLLEVYEENCSKASSLDILKKQCGASKIVAFGDNVNDIPLFAAADECYATQNAFKKLKDVATGVIGKNSDDSVAKFIQDHFKNNR